jgi:hypothetical protein
MEDEGSEEDVDIEKTLFDETDTNELAGNPSSHIAEILEKTTTLTPQARQNSRSYRACYIAGYTIFNNDAKVSSPKALPTTQSTILPPLKFSRACAAGDEFCKFVGQSLCPKSFCKNKSCPSRTINVPIHDACGYNVWSVSRYGKRKKSIAACSVTELIARQIVALIETIVYMRISNKFRRVALPD